MPFYLIQVAYNDTAAKAMIADPQPRENVTRKTAESLGGKLACFLFLWRIRRGRDRRAAGQQAAAALALAGDGGGALARVQHDRSDDDRGSRRGDAEGEERGLCAAG